MICQRSNDGTLARIAKWLPLEVVHLDVETNGRAHRSMSAVSAEGAFASGAAIAVSVTSVRDANKRDGRWDGSDSLKPSEVGLPADPA